MNFSTGCFDFTIIYVHFIQSFQRIAIYFRVHMAAFQIIHMEPDHLLLSIHNFIPHTGVIGIKLEIFLCNVLSELVELQQFGNQHAKLTELADIKILPFFKTM